MATVLGVGGVFFKSGNPTALGQWYRDHLGMAVGEYGADFVPTTMPDKGMTVWCPFAEDTQYFSPSEKGFMFNLVVDDLAEALKQVVAGGGQQVGEIVKESYGHFGWFLDPEGNKVELWQPM
ncbi:VOC family protein [Ferrimonas kyonanensis]|uniref:VOC family protein n=1 Tax=Ferrimonas kyonanensis TaxID=364763 RepID=UPI000419E075|nr:VOC family protein [Ferrimonas kyonanensis]